MRAVNLLPSNESATRRRMPNPWVWVAALAPILAFGLIYYGYSSAHSSVQKKQSELTAANAHLAAMGAAAARGQAESGLLGQLSQRQAALLDALGKEMPWDVTLNDLARVMPKDVWLTSLSVQSPTPADVAAVAPIVATTTTASTTTSTTETTTTAATPVAPTPAPVAFTISGYAGSQGSVAELLARLQLMPMLNNVTLGSTTSAPAPNGKGFVQFQVTASVQAIPTGVGL